MWCELLGRDADRTELLAAATKVTAWLNSLALDGEPNGSVTQEEVALFLTHYARMTLPGMYLYRAEVRMLRKFGGAARG